MPHKTAVADHLDARPWGELSDTARRLRRRQLRGGRRRAPGRATTPTAPGSWPRWRPTPGSSPAGRRCVVLGAGGAARALSWRWPRPGPPRWWWSTAARTGPTEAAALAGPVGRVGAFGAPTSWPAPTWWSTPPRWGWTGGRCPVDPDGLAGHDAGGRHRLQPAGHPAAAGGGGPRRRHPDRAGHAGPPGGGGLRAVDGPGGAGRGRWSAPPRRTRFAKGPLFRCA